MRLVPHIVDMSEYQQLLYACKPIHQWTDLGEECVETVDLLPLLNVGIVLSNSLQCQLIHQVDGVGRVEVTALGKRG